MRNNDQLRTVKITAVILREPRRSVLGSREHGAAADSFGIGRDAALVSKMTVQAGWVTANTSMAPRLHPQSGRLGQKPATPTPRGTEIQRIIGRSLRAAIDLSKIGPHTIALDCQVLQADGGTRTAAICGAWVALADAIARLPRANAGPYQRSRPLAAAPGGQVPGTVRPGYYDRSTRWSSRIAAVSVGVIDGQVRLDLDYADDSQAEVDLNVACTAKGRFVEVQGSSERGAGYDRARPSTECWTWPPPGVSNCNRPTGCVGGCGVGAVAVFPSFGYSACHTHKDSGALQPGLAAPVACRAKWCTRAAPDRERYRSGAAAAIESTG